ncbi:hypothetical protein Dimus_011863 [Dionaea muscipula]
MEEQVTPSPNTDAAEEPRLANSELSTREEVLLRRSRRVKQLAECYRDYYWSLMEELRLKYREYYWKYGKSPFVEEGGEGEEEEGKHRIMDDQEKYRANGIFGTSHVDNSSSHNGNGNGGKLGLGSRSGISRCAFPGCRSKAMALTSYCHPHILCDSKQVLYKGCKYLIKSGPTGRVLCRQPVLRSNVASLCPIHFQRVGKNVTKALKKAGLSVAASTRLASKFHLVVTEYVHHIQAKRKAAMKETVDDLVVDEEYFDPFFFRKND